jgi:hypothetical protein
MRKEGDEHIRLIYDLEIVRIDCDRPLAGR